MSFRFPFVVCSFRPNPAQRDPKYSILHSQPKAKLFSLELNPIAAAARSDSTAASAAGPAAGCQESPAEPEVASACLSG